MIFAKDMKEKADIFNERRKTQLAEILASLYINITMKIDKEIEEAASNGKYGIITSDLSEEIKPMIGRQLLGYSLKEATDLLCGKITELLKERGFMVKNVDSDSVLFITW